MRPYGALVILLAIHVQVASGAMAQDRAGMEFTSPCLQAAATAESEWALPPGMLAAIGRVESGRWNPRTYRMEPWPWTVNAAGAGRYHPVLQDALADVTREQAAGVRSVDVGCFQVNLMHHPTAFTNLIEAFDPLTNARYAARFLTTLRRSAGNWDLAVAQYHSAVSEIGEPYRQRVLATWQGSAQPMPAAIQAAYTRPAQLGPRRLVTHEDLHVIFIGTAAASIRGMRRNVSADPHVIRIRG